MKKTATGAEFNNIYDFTGSSYNKNRPTYPEEGLSIPPVSFFKNNTIKKFSKTFSSITDLFPEKLQWMLLAALDSSRLTFRDISREWWEWSLQRNRGKRLEIPKRGSTLLARR